MGTKGTFILCMLLLGFSGTAHAERFIRLFEKTGQPVPEYNSVVNSIGPGDTLVMGPTYFKIDKFLGGGDLNRVFRLQDGRVLRIAANTGYLATLDEFIDGTRTLRKEGVPVVAVDEKASRRGQYVVQDFETIHFVLSDLNDPWKGPALKKSPEYRKAMQEFPEFARQFWRMQHIRDLHTANVAYTKDGWKVLDLRNEIEFIPSMSYGDRKTPIYRATPFEKDVETAIFKNLPEAVSAEAAGLIAQERAKHLPQFPSWCSRAWSAVAGSIPNRPATFLPPGR